MKRNSITKRAYAVFLLLFLLQAAYVRAQNNIDDIIVTEAEDGNSALIVIETQKVLRYSIQRIDFPPQIQVQILEDIPCGSEILKRFDKKLVQGVKYNCQNDGVDASPRSLLKSLNISLNQSCTVSDSQNDWILSLALRKAASDMISASVPASDNLSYSEAAAPVYMQAPIYSSYELMGNDELPRMSLSSRPTLEEMVRVGLANHKPLEIAEKELRLAKRRLFEARRNYFPALSGRGTEVNGKTQSDPNDPRTVADFVRKEVGFEIGQPIFQSGRIYFSEKQARAQMEIAQLQVDKIKRETTFEIIKAFYGYVVAKEALAVRRGAQAESKKVVDTTQKKKEIGVSSESEYLGVLSAGKQLDYKVLSQEKDLEIAEARLLGTLNLEKLTGDVQVNMDSDYAKIPVRKWELDAILGMATNNRPELKIASLTRKYKEYARKAARGDYLVKVDASAFVGQSGASFRSESLTMKDSYNVGLKGVLYFGGSSFSPTATKEKTAPDLGSTSRTETDSKSIVIGVLDSLGAASKVLEASIEEEKAGEDYRKAKKDIVLEAKEAFFNFEKSKLQIDSAKTELEYRKKEAFISREKDRHHQVEATQFLQSLTSLTEAEIGLKEATSFYLISIAALDKATAGAVGYNNQ